MLRSTFRIFASKIKNEEIMIFFFSGNGNTQLAAERIAKATNDTIVNISEYITGKRDINDIHISKVVGIFFPTHAWYAPKPVLDFVEKLQVPAGTYRYAVTTCGDSIGRGMHRFVKHFPVDSAWSIRMTETYIPLFNIDDDELAMKKLSASFGRMDEIAQLVNQRIKKFDVVQGMIPFTFTYIVNPFFVRYLINPKKFKLDAGCTHCGTCRQVCPMENIQLVNGFPQWGEKCITCMACVHNCPQKIIQYGSATRKRGRYSLKRLLKKMSVLP
jgi:ferredoxin